MPKPFKLKPGEATDAQNLYMPDAVASALTDEAWDALKEEFFQAMRNYCPEVYVSCGRGEPKLMNLEDAMKLGVVFEIGVNHILEPDEG